MANFDVVISKTATITVEADNKEDAIKEAGQVLDGNRGYSEYSHDGWEIIYELVEETL